MEITELLFHTKKNGASDLHICSGLAPAMRINGEVITLRMEPLTPEAAKEMLYSIMTDAQRADYERDLETDFAIQFGDNLRFRVNAYNTLRGPSAAFRVVPTKILSLEELNMPSIMKRMAQLRKGLVLVTGPTGSGKSTTLAAIIDYINAHMHKHIITIEDPIEFVHEPKKCIINQRELSTSTLSFAKALKSALRQDPDVILVGELRDLETIELALSAAETGHLVMGTLHTSSAAKTVDRIVDVFPAEDKGLVMSMLSTSLEAVVSQTLIKRKDGKGRVAVLEILLGTPAVRNLIRENKLPQIYSLMQVGSKQGMRTMKDSVYGLFDQGIITMEAARAALNETSSDEENNAVDELNKKSDSAKAAQKLSESRLTQSQFNTGDEDF